MKKIEKSIYLQVSLHHSNNGSLAACLGTVMPSDEFLLPMLSAKTRMNRAQQILEASLLITFCQLLMSPYFIASQCCRLPG